jgi:hypothetical protein
LPRVYAFPTPRLVPCKKTCLACKKATYAGLCGRDVYVMAETGENGALGAEKRVSRTGFRQIRGCGRGCRAGAGGATPRRCNGGATRTQRRPRPTTWLGGSSTSRGRASNAANRSSRDVPTPSFARNCAGGGGRVGSGERRLDGSHAWPCGRRRSGVMRFTPVVTPLKRMLPRLGSL